MHANRILLYLLILTSLVLDLVLVVSLSDSSEWPHIFVAGLLGLAAGQINLATLGGVLGNRHLPWRVTVLLVVPLGWSFAIVVSAPQILPGYGTAATWGVHFLTQTALLASILFLIRMRGACLPLGDLQPSNGRGRRLQFTLRYLFAWLTATAVALSALKTTFEHTKFAETRFQWDAILILGFVNAALGLIAAWIVLDTRAVFRRLAATMITALPAAAVIAYTIFLIGDLEHLVAVLVLWFFAALYSALAVIVLRVAGFRITWPTTSNVPADSGITVQGTNGPSE